MTRDLVLYFRRALLGTSVGALALLLSASYASAQVGDPKASPRDNPAGHVGSASDERSRDNNDSARDTDTRDTTRSASKTANSDTAVKGTGDRRDRTSVDESRGTITNRGQRRSSGIAPNQQQDQEFSQGNTTSEARRSSRSTSTPDTESATKSTADEAASDTESTTRSESRAARRDRSASGRSESGRSESSDSRSDATDSSRNRSAGDADSSDRDDDSTSDATDRRFFASDEGSSEGVGRSARDDSSSESRSGRTRSREDRSSESSDSEAASEATTTGEDRESSRDRFGESGRRASERSAESRSRDTARSAGSESRFDSEDSERDSSRAEDRAEERERRTARDAGSEDAESRMSRSGSREDRFGESDRRSDYRDTRSAADRSSRDTRSYSRDTYRDEDRFADREDRYSTREDRFSRDEDRDYDRSRYARDSYDRRDLRSDVRDTARDVRDTARDVRDTVRDTARSARESRSVRSSDFDVNTVRSADVGLWFDRSTRDGLVISDVASSGPIARLGFREGDQIVSVNGTRVRGEREFVQYLFAEDVREERVPVVVYRNGVQQTIYIEPATLVEQYTTVQHDPLEQIGIVPDDRYYNRVVVWRVIPRSPAYYAGLRPGDVITTWDRQRLARPNDLIEIVREARPGEVQLQVYRANQPRQLSVEVPQLAERASRRTAYRPSLEGTAVDVERPLEGREQRIEERREMRFDNRGIAPGPATGVEPRPGVVRPGGVFRGGLLPRR